MLRRQAVSPGSPHKTQANLHRGTRIEGLTVFPLTALPATEVVAAP